MNSVKLAFTRFDALSLTNPLIILPGLFGSKQNWRSLSKALSVKGIPVTAVDLRNHGDSPHTPTHDYKGMCSDVAAFVKSQGWSKVNLLGHSM